MLRSRALVLLIALLPLPAAEYVVAPQGDDAAAGTSAAPLRTIGAAAKRAGPGDTVTIRAGTYRETVVPARSGEPGRPITFRGAAGEKVVIDGTDPITGWKPWKDGIEQAPMPGDWFSRATPGDGVNLYDPAVLNNADQVFVDGVMAVQARWPNSPTLDPSFPAKAVTEKFIAKSRDKQNWTTGILEDAQFDLTPAQAVGAQIMLQPNHGAWAWLLTGRIAAVEGKRFTYISRSDSGKDFSQDKLDDKSRYYLFDKLELLDAPGEWHHDKQAGVLYLKSPDGKPLGTRIGAKKRLFAFDLSERSHIVIRDLAIHACTITTDRDGGGDNIPTNPDGSTRYPWRNAAHGLPAEPYHQPDKFRDAPSSEVVIENIDATYISHFTDVSGHFFCQWGQSSGIVLSGRSHRIAGSRIRWSSGNGITLLGREHRAVGNLIEDTGYAANDCTAVHTGGTERISSDHEIAWNTIRRTGRSGLLPRCFYRSEAAGDSDWKGRIHHNDISQFGIQDWDVGGVYGAGAGRYLRFDHNWIHDAYEHVDDLGQGAFTASGIYPDYGATWVIDHNVIWNVEWGIHLQNQDKKDRPAGYLVFNNTVAVRMMGGQKSMHGPYGVVRNSDAPNQETRIEDNVVVLLDQSARYKPVDFASDAAVQRVVEGNISVKGLASGELAGGTDFPACLVPVASASEIVGRAGKRDLRTVAGLPLPPIDSSPDRGAFAAGAEAWRPGHEAWPGRQAPPAQVVAQAKPAAVPAAADPAARQSAAPTATPATDPATTPQPAAAAESSSMPMILGLLGAVAVIAVIALLANRRPTGHRGHRR
jgi:hypothetical protein